MLTYQGGQIYSWQPGAASTKQNIDYDQVATCNIGKPIAFLRDDLKSNDLVANANNLTCMFQRLKLII